jgi:hypothetical protein
MRSPEAVRALPELVRDGVLTPERAAPLLAAARGELVSIRAELRALLGLAVVALTAAVGLFLKEHHLAIGPLGIAALLALAASACLLAARRRMPAFSWAQVEEADWIVDGLVLLTVGLVGADLAWIEAQLSVLGADWPWHLLLMSAVTGLLAVRFDSIATWTLALATFAAWRGVSVAPTSSGFERALLRGEGSLRWNLLACAAVFALAGWALARFDRKRHFEPATTFLAALAGGVALAGGLGEAGRWWLWALALAGLGGGVARAAFRRRRLALFALGAVAVYVGATRFLFEIPGWFGLGCFWFAATSVGAVVLLVVVHRRFRAEGER